jgi:hypothetical protein
MKDRLPPRAPEPPPTPAPEQQAVDAQSQPVPRTRAESPQEFYERVTKREDVRRLLKKLVEL